MQTVSFDRSLCSPLFNSVINLYNETSDIQQDRKLLKSTYPIQIKELLNVFKRYDHTFDFNLVEMKFNPIQVEDKEKDIVVCCSGGKDSIATVMYYLERGYNVVIYHLLNINKCYADEYKQLEKLASYLGIPLILDKCKLTGNHMYTEHPLKNWIIASSCLDYTVTHFNHCNIAFGSFNTAFLTSGDFDVDGGDSVEMWEIYNELIQLILPNFKMQLPIKDVGESFRTLLKYPELLPMCQSCIGTLRFREYKRKVNTEKYHIEFLPNRCTMCWKCAMEYIFFCDHDIYEFNREYYKYCINVLFRDVLSHDSWVYNIQELWDMYLFYDIKKSKMGEDIHEAIIYSRKIKFIEDFNDR